MERRIALPMLAVVALAAVAACSAREAYREELAETPAGSRHAVHTKRLQRVMRGLDRLTRERPPQELDLETASDPWLDELVATAEAIAASAEQIPEAAWSEGSLTGPERAEFHRRAALLRERALALARGAPDMTLEQRAEATRELSAVCDGCHAEFRAPRPAPGSDPAR